jgi:hypothetical protein
VICDYLCEAAPGADLHAVRAGDDAADVRWFSPDQAREVATAPGLLDALAEWEVW